MEKAWAFSLSIGRFSVVSFSITRLWIWEYGADGKEYLTAGESMRGYSPFRPSQQPATNMLKSGQRSVAKASPAKRGRTSADHLLATAPQADAYRSNVAFPLTERAPS